MKKIKMFAVFLLVQGFSNLVLAGANIELLLTCKESRLVFVGGEWRPTHSRFSVVPVRPQGTSYIPHLDESVDREANTSYQAQVMKVDNDKWVFHVQKNWHDTYAFMPTSDQFSGKGDLSVDVDVNSSGNGLLKPMKMNYFLKIENHQNRFGYFTFSPEQVGYEEWFKLECENAYSI